MLYEVSNPLSVLFEVKEREAALVAKTDAKLAKEKEYHHAPPPSDHGWTGWTVGEKAYLVHCEITVYRV